MFEQVCEVRAVPAEGVDGGGDGVEAMGGSVMGGLVAVCSSVQVTIAVALSQRVAYGEIRKEAACIQ